MRILYDGQAFIWQRVGGISRYFAELVTELAKLGNVDPRILAPFYINDYLGHLPRGLVLGVPARDDVHLVRVFTKKTTRSLSSLASRVLKPDIAHETYFCERPYIPNARVRVTTIYDMIYEIPEIYPDAGFNKLTRFKRASLERCDHVICISKSAQEDLCRLMNYPIERTSVVYLASSDFGGMLQPSKASAIEGKPYFLYVGGRGGHKNFVSLLRAFGAAPRLHREFRIVCFGGGPLKGHERDLIAQLNLPDDAVILVGGSDLDLAQAYRGAVGLVYPSAYEGFGLPPLEAMSASCPVISSNAASIPEVVGDAGIMVPPYDVDALAHAMTKLADDADLRKMLVEKGAVRWREFSWERCAKETLAVYNTLV